MFTTLHRTGFKLKPEQVLTAFHPYPCAVTMSV